jgi:hypothetical protein
MFFFLSTEEGSSASSATLAFLNEMGVEGHLSSTQDSDGATHTYIILNNANADSLQLQPVTSATAVSREEGGTTVTLAEMPHGVGDATATGVEVKKTPGKHLKRHY